MLLSLARQPKKLGTSSRGRSAIEWIASKLHRCSQRAFAFLSISSRRPARLSERLGHLAHRGTPRRLLIVGMALLTITLPLVPHETRAADPEDGPPVELTPESPEVREAVARAANYLANLPENADNRAGAKALVALALLKSGAANEHPKMSEAVEAIRESLRREAQSERPPRDLIYSTGVSIVFLVALDPKQYQAEIKALLRNLFALQKPHGGWGYVQQQTGDTSMTQYAVLALWEASRAGFRVPTNVWTGVARWLLATQDPSGAFGYQGIMAEGNQRVAQQQIRITLAAAGVGSLYICASYLRPDRTRADKGPRVPPQFRPVSSAEKGKPSLKKSGSRAVDVGRFRQALQDGDSWLDENFTAHPNLYPYYFCYTFERYASFRDFFGAESTVHPTWYTEIASDLIDRQGSQGQWASSNPIGSPVATAFAVLFLTRSTRQSLKDRRYAGGTLVGGRGLPDDVSRVQVRSGRVAPRRLSGPADELLRMLQDPTLPEFSTVAAELRTRAEANDEELRTKADRLRELADSDDAEARAAVLTALARSRELDVVPLLIRALDDPDRRVMLAARNGLRFLSRKFEGFGLRADADEQARQQAIKRWKAWYRAVRGDAAIVPMAAESESRSE